MFEFCEFIFVSWDRIKILGRRKVGSVLLNRVDIWKISKKTWGNNIQPILTKTRRKSDSTRNQNSKLI